jgi:2-dehydropantoate 2-reductase
MQALLKEAFQVAEAVEIPLQHSWDEYYRFLLEKQLPPTAEHRSSMLQDIERGKQTEIDYLNGAVVSLGKKLGIKTPVNETITNYIYLLTKDTSMQEKNAMVKRLLEVSRNEIV